MPSRRAREKQQQEPQTPPGGWRVLEEDDPDAWPLACVFDLDYTLWDLWIDTHVTPPLKRNGDEINHLSDRRGGSLSFYPEVPGLLADLKRRRIHIAAASRTGAVDLAREALSLLLVPDVDGKPVRAQTYFNTMEIHPGSKLAHFRDIHRKTGIPYEQMLFFDDEHRNFEVESVGVTMQFITDGTNLRVFKEGLEKWRRRRGIRVVKSGEKRLELDR